jgi:hypothetical protein
MSQPTVYKPEEDPIFLLFKRAMETAGPKQKEGHSFRLRVEKDGAVIDFETSPPPTIMGGRGGGSPPAAFDKAKALAVVQEYPDLLNCEEKDGRLTVSTKKYLDKEWDSINGKLKAAGMRYSREARRWEQA